MKCLKYSVGCDDTNWDLVLPGIVGACSVGEVWLVDQYGRGSACAGDTAIIWSRSCFYAWWDWHSHAASATQPTSSRPCVIVSLRINFCRGAPGAVFPTYHNSSMCSLSLLCEV